MFKPKGVGIHVFAGGFTMGVKQVLPVTCQLEIHNFGRQTCEKHGTKFINADKWSDWLEYKKDWSGSQFCYGNPRCTAFSSYSSGASAKARGPNAVPTQDIRDLCNFGVKTGLDLIAFESVQQAFTVGQPLLRELINTLFIPNDYRICHLFVNTAAEGNAQKRRRYFFVAYKNHKNFNIYIPRLQSRCTTVGDILGQPRFTNAKTKAGNLKSKTDNYDADTYHRLSNHNISIIPYLKQREGFHTLAKKRPEELKKASPFMYKKWEYRTSGIPFSLHAPTRIGWRYHCPTICSTSTSLIHPLKNRSLTVGELAALMGWPDEFIPAGPQPIGQIGKGVVPATGAWLAEQILAYFNNDWGNEDFEASYDNKTGHWLGTDYTRTKEKPIEKVFNMTSYIPPLV